VSLPETLPFVLGDEAPVYTGAAIRAIVTREALLQPGLEFTKTLGGLFHDQLIGAFSAPVPKQDPLSAFRYPRAATGCSGIVPATTVDQDAGQEPCPVGDVGQEFSCTFEEIAADTGEATVVIRGGDYLGDFVRNAVRIEEDLHLSD
jgi:hypothetical protein